MEGDALIQVRAAVAMTCSDRKKAASLQHQAVDTFLLEQHCKPFSGRTMHCSCHKCEVAMYFLFEVSQEHCAQGCLVMGRPRWQV